MRQTSEAKVAIVTGASSGIGLACVQQLLDAGWRVAAVARTASKLEALQQAHAGNVLACPLDVADRAALLALPAHVHRHFGRLDAVVNNAGLHHRGSFVQRTPQEIAAMIEINLTAPMLLTRAALPYLDPDGSVVQVASLSGKAPLPTAVTYSATKFALRTFTLALREDLREQGMRIRLSNINPGPVDTGFLGEDLNAVTNLVFSQPLSTADQVAAAVLQAIRTGEPEIDMPPLSGKLVTLSYLWPGLGRALRPALERKGARAKAALIAQRQARGDGGAA